MEDSDDSGITLIYALAKSVSVGSSSSGGGVSLFFMAIQWPSLINTKRFHRNYDDVGYPASDFNKKRLRALRLACDGPVDGSVAAAEPGCDALRRKYLANERWTIYEPSL